MSVYLTRTYWTATLERAAKSGAQVAVIAWGQDLVGVDKFAANLGTVLVAAASGIVLSVLTSVASAKIGPEGSPSLV